jgi:hypothetical protein
MLMHNDQTVASIPTQLAPETGCHRCIFAAPLTRTLRASYSTREPETYWVVWGRLFEARPKSRSRTSARMLARASCSASNASCSRNSASCRAACDMARSVTGAALSERARLRGTVHGATRGVRVGGHDGALPTACLHTCSHCVCSHVWSRECSRANTDGQCRRSIDASAAPTWRVRTRSCSSSRARSRLRACFSACTSSRCRSIYIQQTQQNSPSRCIGRTDCDRSSSALRTRPTSSSRAFHVASSNQRGGFPVISLH